MEETVKRKTQAVVRELFHDDYEQLLNDGFSKVVVKHFGTFSMDFTRQLSSSFENLMISIGDDKSTIKRMFTILTEGMNNTRKHGALDEMGRRISYLFIAYKKESYKLRIANLVDNEFVPGLSDYIDKINALTLEELEKKHLEGLDNEFIKDSSGSGLGMVLTRLKTGNSIEFHAEKVNDTQHMCSFSVVLPR